MWLTQRVWLPKICFFILCGIVNSELTRVQYYANLIQSEIAKISQYIPPTSAEEYRPKSIKVEEFGTFDFIIVGSGAGGSVLANRLSENRNFKILLLEAGGFENDFTDIPGVFPYVQSTKYNWNYVSTPQNTSCLGMVERRCVYPRGKGFGGSTIINAQIYSRGNKNDYDRWASEGNPGWSYKDVLPYFKKSENNTIPDLDSEYHGKSGEYKIKYHLSPVTRYYQAFKEANQELGLDELDYNGRSQIGVSKMQGPSDNGKRLSAGKAFIKPILQRKNIKISGNSYVTKLNMNKKNMAEGVYFTKNGKSFYAKAKKEVILAAGSINTPQILMLSGIGPKQHLQDLKIPVRQDLPVGSKLFDHPTLFALTINTNYPCNVTTLEEKINQFLRGEGFFTAAGGTEGILFNSIQNIRGKNTCKPASTNQSEHSADFEIILITGDGTPFPNIFRHTNETNEVYLKNFNLTTAFGLTLVALQAKSTGTLRLKSKDPFEYPLIDPQMLKDPNDIETMYQGILYIKQLLNTKGMRDIGAKLDRYILPACKNLQIDSKEFWYCHLRQMTTSLYHPFGTAMMLPRSKGGVVDNKLRVYGINRLRICDASVIPGLTTSHPVAPITMIAEKLADVIKATSYF